MSNYKIVFLDEQRTEYTDIIRLQAVPNSARFTLSIGINAEGPLAEYQNIELYSVEGGSSSSFFALMGQHIPAPSGTGKGPSVRRILIEG